MKQLVCTECRAAYYLSETLYIFLIHGNDTLPNKTLIAILKQINTSHWLTKHLSSADHHQQQQQPCSIMAVTVLLLLLTKLGLKLLTEMGILNYQYPVQISYVHLWVSSRSPGTIWPYLSSVAGYDRLTSTHVSYLAWTPGLVTAASLSLVHSFGTLCQQNFISQTMNLSHFGGC